MLHEYLVGEIYGHPQRPDGTLVTTSPVVRREGRVAVTASGTRYELEGEGSDAESWLQSRAPA